MKKDFQDSIYVSDHSQFIKDLIDGENMYHVRYDENNATVTIKGHKNAFRMKRIPKHLLKRLCDNCYSYTDVRPENIVCYLGLLREQQEIIFGVKMPETFEDFTKELQEFKMLPHGEQCRKISKLKRWIERACCEW